MRVARDASNERYNFTTEEETGLIDGKISIDLDLTEKKLKHKFMQSGHSQNTLAYEKEQQIID